MLIRRLAASAAAALALSACWGDLVTNEKIGTPRPPAAGSMFSSYVALGTSISAGIQSGGINDSTQQRSFVILLARSMGLTPGVTFRYPSLTKPGCPPPLTNPLTGARVPGLPTGVTCALRSASSAAPFVNNAGIPSLRAAQVLNILDLSYAATDTLKLAQFITGGVNPIDVMDRAHPTFVTVEVGANDVLGAATSGDTSLLTPVSGFEITFDSIIARVKATGSRVAVMNLPNVTVIPHFVRGNVLLAVKTAGPAPFNLATFTVDSTCQSSSATAAARVGDSTAFPFKTVATILGTLAAGGAASVNCGAGTATTTPASATPLAVIDRNEFRAITQNVSTLNAYIAQRAAANGWALVDANQLLLDQVGLGRIPAFPNFAAPTTTIFGPLFSLDGIHPNAAGHKLIAQTFAQAIGVNYGVFLNP